jgi:acyl-CoA dehydrogenase
VTDRIAMDFSVSPEIAALRDDVRAFIRRRLWPLEADIETSGELPAATAREILNESRERGFYGMNIPSRFGGRGLSPIEICLVEMEIGQTIDVLMRRAFGNVYDILLECRGPQQEEWLLPAVRGDRVCGIAMTETGAGSDAAGIETTATADGDGWILDGGKCYIGDAVTADFFVVTAVTTPGAGSRGISLFLVDKALEGVRIKRQIPMMGMRGMPVVELQFDRVRLGSGHLLAERDRGFGTLLRAFGPLRLYHIGARGVGMARRALDMMVDYAGRRQQFGQPIGEFQMVQTMIADSAVEWNAARLLVLDAAWELEQGGDAREKISMVKFHVAETLGRIADRAVQVFGARGYSKDDPIERIYRDSRVLRIFDGTSEIHRIIAAKGLLQKGTAAVLG